MPKILITGGNGFTGCYLSAFLKRKGWMVIKGIQEMPRNSDELMLPLLNRDYLISAIRGISPDYVVHFAAISHVQHFPISDYFNINVVGTANLLDALTVNDIKINKIIIASSAAVYGSNSESIVSEEIIPDPNTIYAESKYAMERLINYWFKYQNIIVTRPFNYTGISQSDVFVIPKIVNHFKNSEKYIELGNVDIVREYNDVRDIVEIYFKLLLSGTSNEYVNLCSGNGYSLFDVIEKLRCITGHDMDIRINKKYIRTNELSSLIGDNAKLNKMIGDRYFRKIDDTLCWMMRESNELNVNVIHGA